MTIYTGKVKFQCTSLKKLSYTDVAVIYHVYNKNQPKLFDFYDACCHYEIYYPLNPF